jgi:peptidoglycan/LPS O-acetylase OafA/YrhL
MFGLGARFGLLAIAAALLFAAHRTHKSSKKAAKNTAVVMAFLAGLAFLATFVGDWMQSASWLGGLGVAILIVCAVIIVVDWAIDKKPDKPAFWAAFALGFAIVLGASNLDDAGRMISDGGHEVSSQLSQMGK